MSVRVEGTFADGRWRTIYFDLNNYLALKTNKTEKILIGYVGEGDLDFCIGNVILGI